MLKTMSSTTYLLNDLKSKVNVIPDGIIDHLGYSVDELSYKSDTCNYLDYINEYYLNVLKKLDMEELTIELMDNILVSNDDKVPNRLLFAAYSDILLNSKSYELDLKNNDIIYKEIPYYIVSKLERCIKDNNDLKGYNSIRAYYTYLKGIDYLEKYEKSNNIIYLNMYKSILEKSKVIEKNYVLRKVKK